MKFGFEGLLGGAVHELQYLLAVAPVLYRPKSNGWGWGAARYAHRMLMVINNTVPFTKTKFADAMEERQQHTVNTRLLFYIRARLIMILYALAQTGSWGPCFAKYASPLDLVPQVPASSRTCSTDARYCTVFAAYSSLAGRYRNG